MKEINLSPADLQIAKRRYENKESIRAVAADFGIASDTLRKVFRQANIPIRKGAHNQITVSQEEENYIISSFPKKSIMHLAEELGYSPKIPRRILKKHNILIPHVDYRAHEVIPLRTQEEILFLYQNKMPIEAIGAKTDTSTRVVTNFLKSQDIKFRTEHEFKELSNLELKTIVSDYGNRKSIKKIARDMGYSPNLIKRVLRQNNITERLPEDYKYTYTCNQNYFDVIDTEEKAYWLGFIAADGCVYDNRLAISLAIKDKHHLEKFKTAIAATHPIYAKLDQNQYESATIRITSNHIQKALNKLGIVARKSLILKPWADCPALLERHYWRGVVDGDGCISYAKKANRWEINLVGSKDMIEAFRAYSIKITQSSSNIFPHNNIWGYSLCAQKSAMLVNELYSNSTVSLDRKYKKSRALLKKAKENKLKLDLSRPSRILELLESGMTFEEAANQENVSRPWVMAVDRRNRKSIVNIKSGTEL